jgi:hypothetical protein
VARDATARLYDVDANGTVLDQKIGSITFRAKKGCLVDLDGLHESLWATRLGDRTGRALHKFEVTAAGEVIVSGSELRLKVAGSNQTFLLGGDAAAEMRAAVQRGERVVSVTGILEGWNGNFTQFLKALPSGDRRILVREFVKAK